MIIAIKPTMLSGMHTPDLGCFSWGQILKGLPNLGYGAIYHWSYSIPSYHMKESTTVDESSMVRLYNLPQQLTAERRPLYQHFEEIMSKAASGNVICLNFFAH